MRYRCHQLSRFCHCKNRAPFSIPTSVSSFFHLRTTKASFGVAFDIDGVILRGRLPIGGSPQALRRLFGDSGSMKVPFLFLTNGDGIPESRRALELSEILGVKILPSQVVQGHSPFRSLLKRYEDNLIIATGKGEPAVVMSEYGFKKVISLEEYASYFDNIDPVSQYKNWVNHISDEKFRTDDKMPKLDLSSEQVKAAFVVSDPVDWGRDIQVLCDILRCGGLPGQENGDQLPLYFAADDLQYQAAFPSERLGMGAFRTALESVFNRIHSKPLEYVSYGKPNPFVFENAEAILRELQESCCDDDFTDCGDDGSNHFRTLYMIGDNPSVDVKGAKQAGYPWFSILTRTGVFRGKDNDAEFPANLVVDTVEEAVDYILKKEYTS